tara:strand:- start:14893 stop:15198 length:306 start_codon:yes stop_codon:yes gene_type:complete
MKVLLPSNTTHTIIIEPRFYPTSTIDIELYNEYTKEVSTPTITYVTTNGLTSCTFDLVVTEGQRFQIKILEGVNVVYRGKAYVTSQTTQDFELTKDTYVYV